jgi:CRP-like cAMP-binding protein
MATHPDPRKNHLLAALPNADFQRWLPKLEWVDFPLGPVVGESDVNVKHADFPTSAIISLLHVKEDSASAEIAVAGFEGLIGMSLFMGAGSTPGRAVVQSAGEGFRISDKAISEEFSQSAPVMYLLPRYTQALLTQMTQTAACNRHHSVDKRSCRWLLLRLNRLPRNHLRMTHELIAKMLVVRREGVTEAVDADRKLTHRRLCGSSK